MSSMAQSFLLEEDEITPNDSVSMVTANEPAKSKVSASHAQENGEEKEEEVDPFANWGDIPFANGAQQLVQEAEHVNVSDKVSPGMVKLLTTLFKNTKDLSQAKKLAELYPPPSNVTEILAPRLEEGIYKSDVLDYATKRADKELQLMQSAILASIVAILPMLQLMVSRGASGDDQLAASGDAAIDAMQLF